MNENECKWMKMNVNEWKWMKKNENELKKKFEFAAQNYHESWGAS